MQRRKFLQVLGAATVLPSCIQKSYTDFSPPHYDILIKAGEIHDPAHGVHRRADLGVAEGKIAALADDIPASAASDVIDARGLHLTPGLIDLHTHCAFATSPYTVEADPIAARSSLPTTMSKMMYLGMNFDDVLLRATGNAARIINRIPMSGTLQEGAPADIAVLAIDEGRLPLMESKHWNRVDAPRDGATVTADRRIATRLTICRGKRFTA